jgi:hypothetical protein
VCYILDRIAARTGGAWAKKGKFVCGAWAKKGEFACGAWG